MITVETMVTHLEHGDDKEKAATFAYTSTAFPMLTGTLVTVAGFVPIGFAHSAAGEYTFSIFAVVAIALLVSWVVAVLFAPLLGVWILKKPKAAHSDEPGPIMRHFRRFLVLAMRARWVTLLATLCLFGAAIYGMRLVPQQFFPSSDRPELLVDLQLPENASIYATRDLSARVDQLLTGDQDVDHWSTYVGQGAVRFYLPLNVQLPNDFFGQLVVVTKGLAQRERVKAKLEQALATEFPSVVGRVYPLELGPPVGWPLQYRVSGVEPEQVRAIAFNVAQILNDDPSARNVNYNWMEPARTVRIRVDQDQARLLGLSSENLAQALNTVVSGITSTQMRSGIYLVDVLVRASAEQRMSLSTIRALQVPLPNGQTVPLSQIASVDYGQEYPIVWRRDRRPTVTVQADVAPGIQAATVVQALAPKIEALNASLPSGYHIAVGGTVEESSKAQSSVAAVLPLMLILILTVLMIQLQSFNRLFLVLSVAPLGLIGVVAALLLADKPLGFVALLGVLALTGMIARNSVILIDQIEKEKAHGREPWDAVVEATTHRFRPILLTAAAAILGMIPIAPTIFWGPMAYAIMGGLAVATLLTLVFLPALYVTWFRIKSPIKTRASASIPNRPPWSCNDLKRGGGDDKRRTRSRKAASRRRMHAITHIAEQALAERCLHGAADFAWRHLLEATLHIDPTLLGPVSALLGAIVGGGASLVAAIYTQRCQDRLQRVAREVEKREAVYADFVMHASNLLLNAYTRDEIVLGGDEPRLIGLINRMRLFASPEVVGGAEKVLRVIVEISLKPSIELRQLAKEALSKGLDPDPLLAFSSTCRADLDNVRRTTV